MAVAACTGAVSAGAVSSASMAADPTAVASPSPTPTAAESPAPSATATISASPTPVPVSGIWTYNVYDARAVRWQDPDSSACVAASALIMLNLATYWHDYAAADGQPDPLPVLNGWKPDVSYAKMEELLAYERETGTMDLRDPGSDAHGWRNSMNYYGWGNITSDVYRDMAFGSFQDAAHATVLTLAMYRKPVGILGWAGDHAQVVTGYKVKGHDSRAGLADFTILGVYLTDPLASDGFRNHYVPLATWESGGKTIRFTPYKMTNSPNKDPIDGKIANDEWYGKWVIVAPVA
jgi:hypothetical protein